MRLGIEYPAVERNEIFIREEEVQVLKPAERPSATDTEMTGDREASYVSAVKKLRPGKQLNQHISRDTNPVLLTSASRPSSAQEKSSLS